MKWLHSAFLSFAVRTEVFDAAVRGLTNCPKLDAILCICKFKQLRYHAWDALGCSSRDMNTIAAWCRMRFLKFSVLMLPDHQFQKQWSYYSCFHSLYRQTWPSWKMNYTSPVDLPAVPVGWWKHLDALATLVGWYLKTQALDFLQIKSSTLSVRFGSFFSGFKTCKS